MSGTASSPRVAVSPTLDDFEIAAAHAAAASVTAAVKERGGCLIAFSGGRTPCGVYRRLGDLLVSQSVDLSRSYLIFADERMVPPDDSASNYGMVRREFISRVPIPPAHVCRIRGEENADTAARDYERDLQTILPLFGGRCDLVLLGVGEDGHTASLFPGTDALRERQRMARAVYVPSLEAWRVTLTLPVVNRARAVAFLVTGGHKAAIVGKILSGTHAREDLPASLVRPETGTLTWVLDTDAASLCPQKRSFMTDTTFL